MKNITAHTVRPRRIDSEQSPSHAPAMEGLESRTLFAGNQLFVNPGQSIQNAVNQAGPGDVIYLASGTYQQSVNFSRSGTWSAPIVMKALDGANVNIEGYIAGNGTNIMVQGVTVQNLRNKLQNENAAVRTNTGWILKDMVVQNNTGGGVGVFGNGVILDGVTSQYNGSVGLGGAGVTNSMIENCNVAFNNRGVVNPPWAGQSDTFQINGKWFTSPVWEGGGGKWHGAKNVAFVNFDAHDNGGPGLWFDGSNSNIYIMNSEFFGNVGVTEDWQGMGVQVEISPGPFYIYGNYFHDNEASGLDIAESTHADVLWNTFNNDNFELRAMRGRGIMLDDVKVHSNKFINAVPFFSIREAIGAFSIYSNAYANGNDLNGGRLLGEVTGSIRDGMPDWSW